MKPKNIKQAKQLIVRYETISLEEIEEAFRESNDPANYLTGFGGSETCILCVKIDYKRFGDGSCSNCIYGGNEFCHVGKNRKTYMNISEAETPGKLLKAYWLRAKHIRQIINWYK